MKNQILWIAALVCGIWAFSNGMPLRAENSASVQTRNITTSGEAEVKVAPDEVVLILGVETWDANLNVAKQQNDERVQRVIAVTQNFGIDSKYVQTEHISVEPRYRNGTYAVDEELAGYYVRKTTSITLKDIARFEDLYTAVLQAGANHVYNVQFRTTDLRKYRDQARALAIQAAKEKAAALAGELGQSIGKPQTVTENQSGWYSWYGSWWGGSNAMSQNVVQNVGGGSALREDATFAPGQISVTARVSVTFDME